MTLSDYEMLAPSTLPSLKLCSFSFVPDKKVCVLESSSPIYSNCSNKTEQVYIYSLSYIYVFKSIRYMYYHIAVGYNLQWGKKRNITVSR